MANNPFGEWIERQVGERGWSFSELARRAGVAPTTILNVINGERKCGPALASGLARALRVPPEEVFRRAGLLPALDDATMSQQQASHLFSQLSEADQERVLVFMRALLEGRR